MENYISKLNTHITLDMLKNLSIDTTPYISKNSETGFKGVYKHKDKFRVQLINNYKNYNLGVYDTITLACKKYAMTNLLLKSSIKGGVSFNTGNSDIKCKKKEDCKNAFDDLLPNEKVKCNKKSGICDRYLHVDKHIEPKVDCRKKINKELAECKINKSKKNIKIDCDKKINKELEKCKNNKSKNNIKIDCRKKINRNESKCLKKKPDCRFKENKLLDICK